MVGSISTHSIHIYISYLTYCTSMLILDSNRLLEKQASITIDHDRPEPCIARLLDPDRHVVVVDSLLPVESESP